MYVFTLINFFMAFYIRYYEDEVLLQKAEEIVPFLKSINKMTPEELDIVDKRISSLRSGTNRIYLDASKRRYLLAIGTAATTIEEFQKKSKTARTQKAPAVEETPAEPVKEEKDMEWKYYFLNFTLFQDENPQSFTFKAKIRNATLREAYDRMSAYLKEKHGEGCLVPEYSENAIRKEEIETGKE